MSGGGERNWCGLGDTLFGAENWQERKGGGETGEKYGTKWKKTNGPTKMDQESNATPSGKKKKTKSRPQESAKRKKKN